MVRDGVLVVVVVVVVVVGGGVGGGGGVDVDVDGDIVDRAHGCVVRRIVCRRQWGCGRGGGGGGVLL